MSSCRQKCLICDSCSISSLQHLTADKIYTLSQVCPLFFLINNRLEIFRMEWAREKKNNCLMKPWVEAKYADGERMFLSRAALLICKAHVNEDSVTCHLRDSKSTSRVAFCICWSSSCSGFSCSSGSDIIYSPHLIPTRPHTEKDKTHAYQAQGYIATFNQNSTICGEIVRSHN